MCCFDCGNVDRGNFNKPGMQSYGTSTLFAVQKFVSSWKGISTSLHCKAMALLLFSLFKSLYVVGLVFALAFPLISRATPSSFVTKREFTF